MGQLSRAQPLVEVLHHGVQGQLGCFAHEDKILLNLLQQLIAASIEAMRLLRAAAAELSPGLAVDPGNMNEQVASLMPLMAPSTPGCTLRRNRRCAEA